MVVGPEVDEGAGDGGVHEGVPGLAGVGVEGFQGFGGEGEALTAEGEQGEDAAVAERAADFSGLFGGVGQGVGEALHGLIDVQKPVDEFAGVAAALGPLPLHDATAAFGVDPEGFGEDRDVAAFQPEGGSERAAFHAGQVVAGDQRGGLGVGVQVRSPCRGSPNASAGEGGFALRVDQDARGHERVSGATVP